jgi:DNA-binding HxlR family transcriptional regulator
MPDRTLPLVNSKSLVMSPRCLAAFRIVGDMPTLGIIHFLSSGSKRFGELESLAHFNPAMLTNRLKQLQAWDVIERHELEIDNQSVSYSLTKIGNKLIRILEQIETFANQLPKKVV